MTKQWVTSSDDHTCDICAALDGLVRPIDEPFVKGVKIDGELVDIMEPLACDECRCYMICTKDALDWETMWVGAKWATIENGKSAIAAHPI